MILAATLLLATSCVSDAALKNDVQQIEACIEKGHSPNDKDKLGRPPIMLAAQNGHLESVKRLLEYGVDINSEAKRKVTALHYAAGDGRRHVVRYLLKKGADPRREAMAGVPADWAARRGYDDIVEILVAAGSRAPKTGINFGGGTKAPEGKKKLLHFAAEQGDVELVRRLLDEGMSPDTRGFMNYTPLMSASVSGRTKVIRFLLERGANPNKVYKFRGMDEGTALMLAAHKGHVTATKMLLDAGANPNTQGMKNTALHYAARDGRDDVVALLLDAGARSWYRGRKGKTALQLAQKSGHHNIAKFIREHH